MGDVDDDHVDTCLDELGGSLEIITFRADRGTDAKPSLRVSRGERQPLLLDDVLGRDQTDQRAAVVDERQLLDLPIDHHPLRFVE